MKLYVGNLSFDITERTLRELFEPFGTVSEVKGKIPDVKLHGDK